MKFQYDDYIKQLSYIFQRFHIPLQHQIVYFMAVKCNFLLGSQDSFQVLFYVTALFTVEEVDLSFKAKG